MEAIANKIFIAYSGIDEKYIRHFEKSVPTAHAQYIFEKDL